MPAHYNFEVEPRSTWHGQIRYTQPASEPRSKRLPVDLTGWDALLQAKTQITDATALFTCSTRVADTPDALIAPLAADGVVTWALDMGQFNGLPDRAFYELLLIDLDGRGRLLLRGQLLFVRGVIDAP